MSHIKELEVFGFRGFGNRQTFNPAVPTGEIGSGLTIIVGPNNSGKSSLIESLTAVTQADKQPPTLSEGKRNQAANSRVEIKVTDSSDNVRIVSTVGTGGSETVFSGAKIVPAPHDIFVLPSRRTFTPFFGKGENDRSSYVTTTQKLSDTRVGQGTLSGRIFHVNNNAEKRMEFDAVLGKIIDPVPIWTIEQGEQGGHYLKYTRDGQSHSSDGLGEGILSVLFIVDALYDSKPGSVIVVDEPELSLHPQLQAKVRDLMLEYAADRQIIISTHSPKFIDWKSIAVGAQIVRVTNTSGAIEVHQLGEASRSKISGFLSDMNNPHVLGLDANEVFFLTDGVVLVEGQEDVMFFPRVLNDLGIVVAGDFYGWGVGGAEKMETIATILSELGFRKVVGIFDNDKAAKVADLKAMFPDYHFTAQPAEDIRRKISQPDKTSLLDDDGSAVRDEFRTATATMFDEINAYLE